MEPIRVLIVDDHAAVRQGIRMMLNTEPAIFTVGEAEDGQEAIYQVEILRPDVVLMDLVMSPIGGLKAIEVIKGLHTHIKIIVVTTFLDEIKIGEALKAGVDGCLLKDGDGEALLQAILRVQRGEKLPYPRSIHQLGRDNQDVS